VVPVLTNIAARWAGNVAPKPREYLASKLANEATPFRPAAAARLLSAVSQ
jgi:hypothetical protein